MINVLTKILKNCRAVGCYYHYVRNIYKEASKLKINKKSAHINIIKKFIAIQLDKKDDKNYYSNFIGKFKKLKELEDFILYYNNQWKKYILNGMFNYTGLSKEVRSNSYIANYNRRN